MTRFLVLATNSWNSWESNPLAGCLLVERNVLPGKSHIWQTPSRDCSIPEAVLLPTGQLPRPGRSTQPDLLPAASYAQTALEERDRALSQEKTEVAQLSNQVTHSATSQGMLALPIQQDVVLVLGPLFTAPHYLFFLSNWCAYPVSPFTLQTMVGECLHLALSYQLRADHEKSTCIGSRGLDTTSNPGHGSGRSNRPTFESSSN